jgi:hypothetical protein
MSNWISGAFGLAGVVIDATITQGAAWWQKRKRHLAYWSAMSAEIDLCRDYAETYPKAMVIAPLYRLPTTAYENGFPALLGDGAVSHNDAKAVLGFYGEVEHINRGLEQANDAIADGVKTDHSVKESMRLRPKSAFYPPDPTPNSRGRMVESPILILGLRRLADGRAFRAGAHETEDGLR